MDIVTKQTIVTLIEQCQGTAISIYMPVYASAKEARQNPIRLKNLITRAEEQLKKSNMGEGDLRTYLEPINLLVDDPSFWQDQNKGLALFLDASKLTIIRLPERFKERVIVGKNFQITPLIPLYQGNGPFYLLSLDQNQPELYLGSRYKLSRVDNLALPESLQEIFDEFYEFHQHSQVHNKTITPNTDLAADRRGTFFGHGGDDVDKNAEIRNYFHRFDKALMTYLKDKQIPLVLAGLGYLHPLYRQANSHPNLLKEGIEKDVEDLSPEELHEQTWRIVEDRYQQNVDQALGIYRSLNKKNGETTTDLETIVSAAHYKRINTLFIPEDTLVWGRFNAENNSMKLAESPSPENQDLLNTAAGKTILNGGNVIVLSSENMPENSLSAAILRY